MKCPKCKSIYFPWYPCCYSWWDNKTRIKLLRKVKWISKEEAEKLINEPNQIERDE